MENLVLVDNRPKLVMPRVPDAGQCCVLDWVNFTFGSETLLGDKLVFLDKEERLAALECAIETDMDFYLTMIFGFKLGQKREKGLNFYSLSWEIGEKGEYGYVCAGGQRGTILVMLSGTGCQMARKGWEEVLHYFLTDETTKRPKLTRVDLAHDDLDGEYLTVDIADEAEKRGEFWTGRGPFSNVEHRGDWRRPTGAGRTLYVGQRSSGKFCRIYEKGRQLGDKDSLWTRAEVEFKSSDRLIPFDILLNPSSYFVGSYPFFLQFTSHNQPLKVEIIEKSLKVSWDTAIENTRRQFGKYIKQFAKILEPKELIEKLSFKGHESKEYPKRLILHDLVQSNLHVFSPPADYGLAGSMVPMPSNL